MVLTPYQGAASGLRSDYVSYDINDDDGEEESGGDGNGKKSKEIVVRNVTWDTLGETLEIVRVGILIHAKGTVALVVVHLTVVPFTTQSMLIKSIINALYRFLTILSLQSIWPLWVVI